MKEIKGYKVFHDDWTCRGMKFEVGKIYEEDVVPECCKIGIHFCVNLKDCFAYYEFNRKNKVTEVIALGDVDVDLKDRKYCTNKIQIVRELDWQEVMDLLNIKKGYRIFHSDWNFKGVEFEVGRIYEEDVAPKYCESGFHYCLNLLDCLDYCVAGKKYRIAEVEALGEIDFYALGEKCCSNKIKVIKELNWLEILNISNTGKYNTGKKNLGKYNTGDCNSGAQNTGNENSGNYNTGDYNYGSHNVGNHNVSSCNTGHYNTRIKNIGLPYYYDTEPEPYYDTGCNTGDYNAGYRNAGNYNLGNYNTGEHNVGNYNAGKYNIGDYNTGDWNKTNFSNGCFNTNTIEPKIFLFNKPSDWTPKIWKNSKANKILSRICVTEWISKKNMTAEERQNHKEYTVTGGYLKHYDLKEACKKWWESLTDREKRIIQLIPNFDAAIFYEITGIDVKQS